MYGNNSENGRFVNMFILLGMKKKQLLKIIKLEDLISIPIKFESTYQLS